MSAQDGEGVQVPKRERFPYNNVGLVEAVSTVRGASAEDSLAHSVIRMQPDSSRETVAAFMAGAPVSYHVAGPVGIYGCAGAARRLTQDAAMVARAAEPASGTAGTRTAAQLAAESFPLLMGER